MESAVRPPAPRAQPAARRNGRRAVVGGRFAGTALLVATARGADGGPAAALRFDGTTLLARLLRQLADLDIREADLITRPEWVAQLEPELQGHGIAVRVYACPDTAADLRAVAAIAGGAVGPIVVANADILTQREALAGLLADPRVATGMLTTTVRRVYRYVGFRTRTRRGRVVSAGTPYHYVHGANGTFLGVLKVAPADRAALADVAGRLAALVDGGLPDGWQEELDAKAARWKLALYRRAQRALTNPDEEEQPSDEALDAADTSGLGAEDVELSPADQAELERRVAAAAGDVPSLLLCGLVRSHVRLGVSHLRRLFWTRPLSDADVARAGERIAEYDEDRALLESAVKANDGFFTTHFVSPYSKYIARWAAHRGWTPNGVTTLSVAIGFAAAAAFATGDRWGMIAGAILLQLAFTFDCVDGQLARYTRTFTKLGAWLDSIFDRTKEYAVFAGLAIGGSGDDIWLLAGAALALQVMRHSIDFSYPAAQHQAMGAVAQPPLEQVQDVIAASVPEPLAPDDEAGDGPAPPPPPARTLKQRVRGAWRALDRSPSAVWVKKMIGFPIGERFAAISITAALWDARVTFIVMLAWGGFAATYTIAGRVLRSIGKRGPVALGAGAELPASALDTYRDDGPLALALGRLRAAAVPASALVLAGLVPLIAVIAIAGGGASWGVAAAAVAWLVLAAGVASGQPLRDRLRWIVPPALRVAEYAGILWLAALAGPSAVPGAVALLLAVTYRHYDIVYRLRHRGTTPPTWMGRLAGGWDGRLVVVFVLAAAAAVPAGLYVAGGLLGVVFVAETIASWASFERTQQPDVYEDEEEDAE